ncbi:MAG TPA: nucleotidyltransferase domain-containing protein [Caulobacteraceae bacterium]|jgi:hypothetical protein|nr:nucleotidyltransferase domain-containing protein [Caulobacteraceae bacterium]
MDRDRVIAILREAQDRLVAQGVVHVALFGSTARGEAGPGSDLDLMVQIDPSRQIGVFEYVGVVQFLESLFSERVDFGRVDVSNVSAQKPEVRATAARDAVYAF